MDEDEELPPADEVTDDEQDANHEEGGEVLAFPGLTEGADLEFDDDAYSTEEVGGPQRRPGSLAHRRTAQSVRRIHRRALHTVHDSRIPGPGRIDRRSCFSRP